MKHELKIWPQYFERVKDGSKTFEVRNNDRGFQTGDEVVLREYVHEDQRYTDDSRIGFTGRNLKFKIGYIHQIDHERVVFSLLPCQEFQSHQPAVVKSESESTNS